MSYGLTPLRDPPRAGGWGTSSITYRGSLLAMNEPTPWMRTEMPPSLVRVTITPGKRVISTSSIGRPGARSMSSAVTTEPGAAVAGETPSVLPSPLAFRWEQATTQPSSNPSSRWARGADMGDLLRVMGLLTWPLGLDDDDAVGAAQAVQRGLGGLLQHLDRFDVAGVDACEVSVGTGIDHDAVEHIQRGVAAPDGRAATDAHREAA